MKFWMLVLLLNLLIPIAMLSNGILYLTKPPQRTVWMYGYRTKRSIKNQETWDFAQKHCGKFLCRLGAGMMLVTIVIMFLVFGENKEIIGSMGSIIGTVEGLLMAFSLLPTERALKQKFGI